MFLSFKRSGKINNMSSEPRPDRNEVTEDRCSKDGDEIIEKNCEASNRLVSAHRIKLTIAVLILVNLCNGLDTNEANFLVNILLPLP